MINDLFTLYQELEQRKYVKYTIIVFISYLSIYGIMTVILKSFNYSGYELMLSMIIGGQITLYVALDMILFVLSFKRLIEINLPPILAIFAMIKYIQIPTIIILMIVKSKKAKLGKKEIENINNFITTTVEEID